MRHFLLHASDDNVGVAVVDIRQGEVVDGAAISNGATFQLTALEDIPLGHKIALKDFKVGDTVLKYGVDIGRVVMEIKKGAHVHVHNLKTKRW